jgi:hypothetical protein
LEDVGEPGERGAEDHRGNGGFGGFDVFEDVFVALEEAKGTAEGDGGDDVEG